LITKTVPAVFEAKNRFGLSVLIKKQLELLERLERLEQASSSANWRIFASKLAESLTEQSSRC